MDNDTVDGKAALYLVISLIDLIERGSPGTNLRLDQYLVEVASRVGIEKEPIAHARQILADLRAGA